MQLRHLLPLALLLTVAACGGDRRPSPQRLAVQLCGDGQLQGREECDDGNDVTETCAYGQGPCEVCDAACRRVPGATSACGDGRIDATHETCDDGNAVTEECPYGERCSICDATCTARDVPRRFCGDGVVDADAGEGCDDGPANDDAAPGACRSDCRPARCGDGVIDPGETCEEPGAAPCRTDCTTGTCGDGVRDPWEACEPALDAGCRGDCTMPFCGDARLDPGEACDDGAFAPRAIAGDASGACAIVEGDRVRCWSHVPALDAVPRDLPAAAQLAVGGGWACVLDDAGRTRCWGEDPLGAGPTQPPGDRFVQIAAGFAHACGLREDGSIRCWGGIAARAPEGTGFVRLAAGHGFSCAVHGDGHLACWGTSTFGETDAPAGSFAEVAASATRACARRTDGGVACWGEPLGATPAGTLHALAVGTSGACALAANGDAVCWGRVASERPGPFSRLSLVGDTACGFGPAGMRCWGAPLPIRANGDGLPGACRSGCTPATCGDGVVDPGEDCDGSPGCSADCRRAGACGDGVVQPAWEACDDGNARREACAYGESCVVCDATCAWVQGLESRCGDGLLDPAHEGCDDGAEAPLLAELSLTTDAGCGLREDRGAICWGSKLVVDEPAGPFVAVGAGIDYACGLRPTGELVCWGQQAYEQTLPPAGTFVSLAVGPYAACAIRDDGGIICWGDRKPEVPADGTWARVSIGTSMACALDPAGQLSCWGPERELAWPRPQGRFRALAVGDALHCAIRVDDTLACWGPAAQDAILPAAPVVAVAVGGEHACAIDRADGITCFGRRAPTPEPGRYRALAAVGHAACGLRLDGAVRCFGFGAVPPPANDDHEPDACRTDCAAPHCGDGVRDRDEACDDRNLETDACPYGVSACRVCGPMCAPEDGIASWCGDGVVDAAAGETCDEGTGRFAEVGVGDGFVCGIGTDAIVRCWGRDDSGQATPPGGWHEGLAVGVRHACALDIDTDNVTCWGAGGLGQLDPPPGTELRFLAAGRDFTCAVRFGEPGLFCWGDVPFVPPATGAFRRLVAGERHVCGTDLLGGLVCWGANDHGQATPPAATATALAAGRNHTCALVGLTPVCWGADDRGQSSPPPGLLAMDIAAGDDWSCGRGPGPTWTCWGAGTAQPPTGSARTFPSRWQPEFACGTPLDGELSCWGSPADPDAVPGPRNSATRPGACRPDCAPARCGDRVVDPGEGCDDGNLRAGDGCSATCAPE